MQVRAVAVRLDPWTHSTSVRVQPFSMSFLLIKVTFNVYRLFQKLNKDVIHPMPHHYALNPSIFKRMTHTYFVSGHIDLTDDEFQENYVPILNDILSKDPDASFVLGDATGADAMTQKFLHYRSIPRTRVTIYYKTTPKNPFDFLTKGPFSSHPEKDKQMTKESDSDIAWIRPKDLHRLLLESQGKTFDPKYVTGTEKNIQRRKL